MSVNFQSTAQIEQPLILALRLSTWSVATIYL